MSPTSFAPPVSLGCSTCPGSENATLGSKKHPSSEAYGSQSVGRTLGRRSLDAFISIGGSLRGHRALRPTTNQKPAVTRVSASAGNSPLEPPTKQKWYDSFRGKSSQTPTPSSPSSMSSSTMKRSRFFWSSPNRTLSGDISPSFALQTHATRDPLPELHVASLQSELQRMSIFGEIIGQFHVEAEPKARSRNSASKKAVRTQNDTFSKAKSEAQAQMVTVAPATGKELSPPASASGDTTEKPPSTVAISSDTTAEKPLDPGRFLCDLYYKGTPWQPELKKSFSDAASALSQFALRHMLSDKRDCNNTLLWTSEIQMRKLQVNETFTVYPLIDGPNRLQIQKNYDLHWAIVTFTDEQSTTKTDPDLREDDEGLKMAVRNMTSMGYHVDVWTYLDDDGWDVDLILAEAELARYSTRKKHMRSLSCRPSVFLDPQHLERRKKYEAFIRHGIAGFLQADLKLLDKLQSKSEALQPTLDKSQLQSGDGPELMGFLEHTEESIAEVN